LIRFAAQGHKGRRSLSRPGNLRSFIQGGSAAAGRWSTYNNRRFDESTHEEDALASSHKLPNTTVHLMEMDPSSQQHTVGW
jgi:hypothetical protein